MLIERSTFLSRLLDRLFSEAKALAVELERKPREDADWDRTNQLLARIEEVSAAMRSNASHDCAIAATSGVTPKEPPLQTCAAGSVPDGLDRETFYAALHKLYDQTEAEQKKYWGEKKFDLCEIHRQRCIGIADSISVVEQVFVAAHTQRAASPSPPVQTVENVGGGTLHAVVTEPAGVEKVIDPTVGRQ